MKEENATCKTIVLEKDVWIWQLKVVDTATKFSLVPNKNDEGSFSRDFVRDFLCDEVFVLSPLNISVFVHVLINFIQTQ